MVIFGIFNLVFLVIGYYFGQKTINLSQFDKAKKIKKFLGVKNENLGAYKQDNSQGKYEQSPQGQEDKAMRESFAKYFPDKMLK